MNVRVIQTYHTAYPDVCKTGLLPPATGKQLKLYMARLVNKSGGTIDVAVLKKMSFVDRCNLMPLAAGVTTDVTTAVLAGTATQIISTTNNDGFIVQSSEIFNMIGLTISQADGGGSTYAYKYWNGTAWAALTKIATLVLGSTGDTITLFAAPIDWAVGFDATEITSGTASQARYTIYVKATTAGAAALKVTAIWAGKMIDYAYQVANNASFTWQTANYGLPLIMEAKEALLPYFGTANAANQVSIQYVVQE